MWQALKIKLIYYPTLFWNVLLGRWLKLRNWWDRIDDQMIIGALPFASDVPKLSHEGVTGVVNTCLEYPGPKEAYGEAGIEQHWMPTVDFTHPKLEDVERAVEFINRQTEQGGTVYVHCKAGRARSATVVMCWLIDAKGMTPGEAQKLLLEKRPHVNPHVESRPVVQKFWAARHSGDPS